jgi:hypothetical protein
VTIPDGASAPTDPKITDGLIIDPRRMYSALAPTARVLFEVEAERDRQDRLWGEQNHANGTGEHLRLAGCQMYQLAAFVRDMINRARASGGEVHWSLIAFEEVFEAMAESEPGKLRAELIQCAATFAAWAESIDRGKQPADGWIRGALIDTNTAERITRRVAERIKDGEPIYPGRPIRDNPQA